MEMRSLRTSLTGVVAALGLAGVLAAAPAQAQQTAYAIANGGTTLIRFNTNNPTGAAAVGSFTLNGTATFLDSIDFRPLNGQLYGYLDSTDTLYTVDTNTAILTAVASGIGASATNTFQLGIDFNPMIDRLRVVTDSGQNLVYNPNSSAAPTVATNLAYAPGDPSFIAGQGPLIVENAYSNNLNGAASTIQYAIDYGQDRLVTLANNTGVLTTVGNLGIDVAAPDAFGQNSAAYVCFDIFTSFSGVNTAYAILDTTGGSAPALYNISLTTGAATRIGGFGSFTQVYGLAVTPTAAPEPGSLALLVGAMATMSIPLYRRRSRKS